MTKTFERNGKKLLYVPIDIKLNLPSEEELVSWHNAHHIIDTDYEAYINNRHVYCRLASRFTVTNWRSFPHELIADKLSHRTLVDDYVLSWHPTFKETFPEIVDAILELPFKQIIDIGWMYQTGYFGAHVDSPDPHDPIEPRRYNILLTNPAHNTFWVGDDKHPIHAVAEPGYPCFAFNNTDTKHGTSAPTGLKISIIIFGILDNTKHQELIARSVEKFLDKAIWI